MKIGLHILGFTLAFVVSIATAQTPVVSAPIALDVGIAECAEPTVALASDGGLGVAWRSRQAGRQTIEFRERIDGVWREARTFGVGPCAKPSSPVLLYDSSDNPRLIWRDGPGDCGSIAYAFRHAGIWIDFGPISGDMARETAAPSAALDAEGRLHIAWLEGYGSFWGAMAATFETDGSLRRQELTEGRPENVNYYPSVLGGDQPTILWFAGTPDAEFILDACLYNPATAQWEPFDPHDLSAIPANRFPHFAGQGGEALFGVWYEEFFGVDRVFLGKSDPLTLGVGEPVDDNPGGPNSQPFVTLTPSGQPVICWKGMIDDGAAIFVRKRTEDGWLPTAVVAWPEPPYPSHPRLIADETTVHVVWTSEADDGGTGNLYYCAVSWN